MDQNTYTLDWRRGAERGRGGGGVGGGNYIVSQFSEVWGM